MVVEQAYLSIIDENIDMLYSFPAILDEKIVSDNHIKWDMIAMFEECKKLKKVVIDYSGYDYETGKSRRVKVAIPIIVDDTFKGILILESIPKKVLEDRIIPQSYLERNY